MINKIFFLLLFTFAIVVSAQELDSPKVLKDIKISLIWNYQSEFAGAIIAKELGFFAEEGYNVEFFPPQSKLNAVTDLKNGKVDYAIIWLSTAIDANSNKDTKIKLVSQIIRHSNTTIMAWRDFKGKKIEKIEDLNGEKLSLHRPPLSVPYELLLREQNVNPIIVTQYAIPALFYKKGIAACTVLKYQGFELLRLHGVKEEEITLFELRKFGIDMPEDGLYTQSYNHDKKEKQAIANAIKKGWLHAKNNPKETAKIVVKYALYGNSKYPNEVLMRNNLKSILPSILPDEESINNYGKLDKKTYEYYSKELLKNKDNKEIFPYEEFVTEKAQDNG